MYHREAANIVEFCRLKHRNSLTHKVSGAATLVLVGDMVSRKDFRQVGLHRKKLLKSRLGFATALRCSAGLVRSSAQLSSPLIEGI